MIQIDGVLAIIALGCAIALIVAPFCFFNRSHRNVAFIIWVKCAVFLLAFTGGLVLGSTVRQRGIERVTLATEPLVRAIHKFEAEMGRPPATLDALVPNFLPAIPRTGIGAYPKFRYVAGQPNDYDGNPWMLAISPPNMGIGFDQILYFPLQNYPRRGYGGGLQRVGKWAYVHE